MKSSHAALMNARDCSARSLPIATRSAWEHNFCFAVKGNDGEMI
jgi:hypothetical protein